MRTLNFPAGGIAGLFNRFLTGGIAGLAILLAAAGAAAHKTNVSTGRIDVSGADVTVRLKLSAHDLAVALNIPTDLITPVPREAFAARQASLNNYLLNRVLIGANGGHCAPAAEPIVDFAGLPAEIEVTLKLRCAPGAVRLRVDYGLFFDIDAGHRGIGVIDYGAGPEEYLFDRGFTALEVQLGRATSPAGDQPPVANETRFARFGRIVALGVEHILSGIDHVLFVLALLLARARFASLVKTVTAFTIAHSLTLALAWYDVIALPGRLVESLIALSIGYVAAGNLIGRARERRWPVAFGFGLVHGLGFYAVLRDLELDKAGAAATLLAFNLGVEVGQIAILVLVWPILFWAAQGPWRNQALASCSAAILLVAGAMLFSRVFLA